PPFKAIQFRPLGPPVKRPGLHFRARIPRVSAERKPPDPAGLTPKRRQSPRLSLEGPAVQFRHRTTGRPGRSSVVRSRATLHRPPVAGSAGPTHREQANDEAGSRVAAPGG